MSGESVAQGLLGGAAGARDRLGGAALIGALGISLEANAPRPPQHRRPGFGPRAAGQVRRRVEHRGARRPGRRRRCSRSRSGSPSLGGLIAGAVGGIRAGPPAPGRGAAERRVTNRAENKREGATRMTPSNPIPPDPLYRLTSGAQALRRRRGRGPGPRRLDLEIGDGEFVVVAGPSGSGKSTLLQLLGALDRPTSGEVLLRGPRPGAGWAKASSPSCACGPLGFIFQQFNLIPTLTAAENVEIALAPSGLGATSAAAAWRAARPGRARRRGRPPALAALRRRAAAGRDRAGARQPPAGPARRRADRQPRLGHRRGDPRAARPALGRGGPDRGADHPRPGDRRAGAAGRPPGRRPVVATSAGRPSVCRRAGCRR